MKNGFCLFLVVALVLMTPCYATDSSLDQHTHLNECFAVSENAESCLSEGDNLSTEDPSAYPEDIDAVAAPRVTCTKHVYEEEISEWIQFECCKLVRQIINTCTNCHYITVRDQYATNSTHFGPYSYEEERWDGIDYRVKYCNACGVAVGHNPI